MDLLTRRLRLEPLEPRHAAALFAGLQCAGLYEHIDDVAPATVDALRERYTRLSTRKSPDGTEHWLNWAIWSESEGRYLGYVQATVQADGGAAMIAYVLFRDAWGRGYAREAVARMIEHLIDAYHSPEVCARVDTRNARSIALLEALGLDRISVRTGAEWIHGVSTDEAEYLLRRESSA
jgi:[ribosomal protein S5]-alanine N-acetyltransferase